MEFSGVPWEHGAKVKVSMLNMTSSKTSPLRQPAKEQRERQWEISGLTLPWKKAQLRYTRCTSYKDYEQHRLGLDLSGEKDGGSFVYSCFKGQFET